jgi:TRAP transporter TAXI family solute receptor
MKVKNICKSFPKMLRLTICLLILTLFGTSGWAADWPKDAKVISPSPGASVHMVQVGLGKVVEEYTPIEHWIVQPLGGPSLWLPLMAQGQCLFANHNAADIINAYLGRGLYEKMGPQKVRTVAAGHDYMFMFWTTPDSGIKQLADLKGKVVYVAQKANPMFWDMAKLQLGSAGLTLDDLKAQLTFGKISDAARDMIEGRVDAMLCPVVPGSVMEVNEAKGECVFVTLTEQQAKYVMENTDGYFTQNIEADDKRFRNKSPVPNAVCFQNAMFTAESTDPEIVYGVVKAIFEHTDEFADSHPQAKYWSLTHRPVANAVPYHEGSIRYFKEKGLWKPENQTYQDKMIQKQKELLK